MCLASHFHVVCDIVDEKRRRGETLKAQHFHLIDHFTRKHQNGKLYEDLSS